MTILAGAAVSQPPADVPAKPAPSTEDLIKTIQTQADRIAALELAAKAQPMPAGGGAQPVKAPAGPKGTGYKPLTPAQHAKFQAQDLAKNGNRIANQAKAQAFPPSFNATTVVPLDVGDQAQCGSCYLCSTGKTATAALRKAGYGKVTMSWQYGMDSPRDFGGCDGGNGTEVIDYMCNNGWIAETYVDATGVTHNDYPPYEADTGRDRTKAGAKVWMKGSATWGFVNRNGTPSVDEIKAAIFNYGRLNIAIDAGGQFSNGTGTITSLGTTIDHEINCSGWDDAKDGGSFLLENQWDTSWGNGGYRWCTYAAAKRIVDWFWVSATPLPPPDPITVAVPNLTGAMFADAKSLCAAVGLSCNLAAGSDATQPIVSQAPVAGSQVVSGAVVTVTTGTAPPPVTGDVVITVPAGTAPGSYTIGESGLSDADKAAIQAAVQEAVAKVLNTADATRLPPPGWLKDKRLAGQMAQAASQAGGETKAGYAKVSRNAPAHEDLLRAVHRRMSRDAEGRALLSQYSSGALPAGWLQNFLDWVLAHQSQILAFIQMIMHLFGL